MELTVIWAWLPDLVAQGVKPSGMLPIYTLQQQSYTYNVIPGNRTNCRERGNTEREPSAVFEEAGVDLVVMERSHPDGGAHAFLRGMGRQ